MSSALPYFNQEAVVDLDRQRVFRDGAPEEEPGFRLCLITVLYLLSVDTTGLGAPVGPMELSRGHHLFPEPGASCHSQRPPGGAVWPRPGRVSGGGPPPGGGKASQRR